MVALLCNIIIYTIIPKEKIKSNRRLGPFDFKGKFHEDSGFWLDGQLRSTPDNFGGHLLTTPSRPMTATQGQGYTFKSNWPTTNYDTTRNCGHYSNYVFLSFPPPPPFYGAANPQETNYQWCFSCSIIIISISIVAMIIVVVGSTAPLWHKCASK